MTSLGRLARRALQDDKSIRVEGEFVRWLENASDKAPEYGPIDILQMTDPEVMNSSEYFPAIYEERLPISLGPEWLLEQCSTLPSALSAEELCEQIVKILAGPAGVAISCIYPNVSLDRRENDLLDLLGFESLEFVSQLLELHRPIVEACRTHRFTKSTIPAPIIAPTLPGQSVTLNTTSSKQATRQYRKLMTKGLIPTSTPTSSFDMHGITAELQAVMGSSGREDIQLPNVFVTKRSVNIPGAKFALPMGTIHNDFVEHEEFIIPYPTDTKQDTWNINILNVNDMDPILQKGFKGYKSLNKMQSAVFPIAHRSNENLLVCAPTGAGKTDVAMLTILKIIRDHIVQLSPMVVSKDDFKIVYVAPMKALAAEITAKFTKRLYPFGIKVREYTGDMQLSRKEIQETQMIVTTPEKWDVITRKGLGDVDLVQKVKLLIIDEVHLLQDDRGPVIETLVARTLREVEMSQRLIRIVGLSATLPNYVDVGMFLRVDLYTGLFVFGETFRPVPLTQQFVGIKGRSSASLRENMNNVCFKKCRSFVEEGHQVMIFVHSRNDTVKTAKLLLQLAAEENIQGIFSTDQSTPHYTSAKKLVEKSKNRELQMLFPAGFAFHHAGMLRSDRSLVEQLFSEGHLKVLVCTSTLAWGVNLPAHAVIIKGTQVYDQQKGDFVSLGVLDVLQIFGRAGRPQFETHGEGIILTPHAEMARYIGAIMSQVPIESQFRTHLPDNLNAEVTLGTVSSIFEAVSWLKYSYLYVRMQHNPTSYGISAKEVISDPNLEERLYKLCRDTAMQLRSCGMVSYDPADPAEIIRIRSVGRIASSFYLTKDTVETFGKTLRPGVNEEELLAIASTAAEFDNLRVREEELHELDVLCNGAPMRLKHDVATSMGKASLLIMAHISKYPLDTFSLISDSNYVAQNGGRILRALFEIVRTQGWLHATLRCLTMCIAFERRQWPLQHPLGQFERLSPEVMRALEGAKKGAVTMDALSEMSSQEIASIVGTPSAAQLVCTLLRLFPKLDIKAKLMPVTREVMRMNLDITPNYDFDIRHHGTSDLWWILVENPLSPNYVHCEELVISKAQARLQRVVSFHIPVREPVPPQLYIRVVSDRWMQAEIVIPVTLSGLYLPNEQTSKPTNLLPLRPLSVAALQESALVSLYAEHFIFFNSIQTQVFHSLYHGDSNVMVGAPTGSGKTVIAELAIWNALRKDPTSKIVYVAPLKALLKERLDDWSRKFANLGIKVIELSGDVTPNFASIKAAKLVLTTPEKWDSVTRKSGGGGVGENVSLLIMDEIHLLGSERGHVLEMVIARMRRKYNKVDATSTPTRLVGLSTALASPADMASWLQIPDSAMFNFRPSVRPVPLEVRIEGFAGRHYCPRMAAMNKPAYQAILSHSPDKPVLIFVSSRRQTRLTANALVSHCVNDGSPRRFVRCGEEDLECCIEGVMDASLKHALSFGIALHHAGLIESDRRLSETLFAAGKVQLMVATSTLAWGLNFPAHLVIVKGTEYYDARSHAYVDVPLTDVIQMIGRAGRPQFDKQAKAVLLVQDIKKDFYKKFLYDAFPLESSLHLRGVLADHLNAEVANERIKNLSEALKMLQGTFLAVRALRNPNYYGVEESSSVLRDEFLCRLIDDSFTILERSHCINRKGELVGPTPLGRIASNYYLSHRTVCLFTESMGPSESFPSLLRLISLSTEFDEAPIRHNEDNEIREFTASPEMHLIWEQFAGSLGVDWSSPHTKVHALLIAYLAGVALPATDFVTDTKSILDQAVRIVAGMIQVARSHCYLETFVHAVWLQQALCQGLLPTDNTVAQLPGIPRDSKMKPLPLLLHERGPKNGTLQDVLDRFPKIKLTLMAKPELLSVSIVNERQGSSRSTIYHRDHCLDKEESWILLIADPEKNVLISYNRICGFKRSIDIPFYAPPGSKKLKLLFLSEVYLGLDQEEEFTIMDV